MAVFANGGGIDWVSGEPNANLIWWPHFGQADTVAAAALASLISLKQIGQYRGMRRYVSRRADWTWQRRRFSKKTMSILTNGVKTI